MALDNNFLLPHQVQPCSDWDPQIFGLTADHQLHEHSLSLAAGSPMSSSEASTGYLQDAVAECSERCKRRRLASPPPPPPLLLHPVHDSGMAEDLQGLFQGFWNPDFGEDPLGNSSYMLQDDIIIPDYPFNMLLNSKTQSISPQTQLQDPLPSISSQGDSLHSCELTIAKDHHRSNSSPLSSTVEGFGSRAAMGLVYPFAVVKPGGFEGDLTLADINAKILMRPKRPVPHPVGEYACTPCCAADRRGLSGKAVVSLTRIHTQGRGTITIIRTRG